VFDHRDSSGKRLGIVQKATTRIRGIVGFYSDSQFVHIDTGHVRSC